MLEQRLHLAWQHFAQQAVAGPQPWVQIVHQRGTAAVETAYRALLDGRADPQRGLMLSLG